ncbi:MAG: hypothetical protein K0S65_3522 [Labilithrix sp.]|nr:hypothetical protein [Labilithrix sp.]
MSHEPKSKSIACPTSAGVLLLTAAMATAGQAQAQDIGEREPIENNSGPGVNVRPGAYFPSRGDTGFAVDGSVTYGIPVDPLVIAPGARFAGYLGDSGAITGMPVAEVMLPIGVFVPYVKGGVGVGHATGPKETSAALMGGGGLDVHVSRDVLVGVDATWETVTGTGFRTVAIGPRVGLRY